MRQDGRTTFFPSLGLLFVGERVIKVRSVSSHRGRLSPSSPDHPLLFYEKGKRRKGVGARVRHLFASLFFFLPLVPPPPFLQVVRKEIERGEWFPFSPLFYFPFIPPPSKRWSGSAFLFPFPSFVGFPPECEEENHRSSLLLILFPLALR